MDLVAELNNQDTKIKKFQVLRMFLLILEQLQYSRDCLFCYDTKYKSVFTFLKFLYLVTLTFKVSFTLEIRKITEVHFQE